MLILEGPDHVGKTTFAKLLVSFAVDAGIPAYYAHMTRPPKGFDFYSHYVDRMSAFAVQDRFHLGARVYHSNELPDERLRMLNARLTLMGSMTVVMFQDNEAEYECRLREQPKIEGEMFPIARLMEVNRIFGAIAKNPSFHGVDEVLDVSFYFPGAVHAQRIVREWKKRLDAAIECRELPEPTHRDGRRWRMG